MSRSPEIPCTSSLPRWRGAAWAVLGLALAGAASACTQVLGMDAPACGEGCTGVAILTTDGASPELPRDDAGQGNDVVSSALDAPATVLVDSGADSPADSFTTEAETPQLGVSCGTAGPCSGATPVCCINGAGAGGTGFGCVATIDSCGGPSAYAVGCDSDNLCPGTDQACCHYSSATKCVPYASGTQACPGNGVTLCDPHAQGSCGASLSCKLVGAGVAAPYYACER